RPATYFRQNSNHRNGGSASTASAASPPRAPRLRQSGFDLERLTAPVHGVPQLVPSALRESGRGEGVAVNLPCDTHRMRHGRDLRPVLDTFHSLTSKE
ncbi:hypothetical protein KEF29_41275, partial [Streptomyces tuirus]|nr:hypothetical protein [Streptomyces tuirus]